MRRRMKSRSAIRLLSALLILCAACMFSACGKPQPKGTPLSVDYRLIRSDGQDRYDISYSLSLPEGGMIGEDGAVLSVRNGREGYEYNCVLNGDILTQAGDIIDDNAIAAWDGFEKTKNRKDTENSFSLAVRYPDGTRIAASGTNAFPRKWDKGSQALSDFFEGLLDEETISSILSTSSPDGTRMGELTEGNSVQPEDIFSFAVDGDSTARITAYNGTDQAVTVPDEISGHIVTGLDGGVFAGSGVVSVSMGSYLANMGESCFENCAQLKEVHLPTELSLVPRRAFAGCVSLERAALPSMVKSVEPQVFEGCAALSEVSLNEGLLSIGSQAFSGCTSLSELNIPYSVTYIADDAFAGCPDSLKLMVYPDSAGLEYAKSHNIKYEEYRISG